uniref:SPATA1_C domain-containing protein n=1 Tax=Schistosoma mansoni TaxID=6183 RepID=A0A5K4F7V5_SCHMA
MNSLNSIESRSRSEDLQLADIHIYVIPPNLWINDLNTAFSQVIKNTVSAGIIRSKIDITLAEFREILEKKLEEQILPNDYIFCKQVGHSLGRIQSNQEPLFKVSEFLPPQSELSEIYVIDRQAIDDSQIHQKEVNQLAAAQHHQVNLMPLPTVGQTRSASPTIKPNDSKKNLSDHNENFQSPSLPTPQGRNTPVNYELPPVTNTHQEPQQQQLQQNISRPTSHYEQRPSINLPVIYPVSNQSVNSSYELTSLQTEFMPKSLTPIIHTGDSGLDTISAAIGHQKDVLQRLEYEQQKRILQMQAEAEERRRREAELYAKELAKNANHAKRMEELEKELRRWTDEAKQTRERLDQLKSAWDTALKSKEEEITTLRQGLELMKKSRDDIDSKPTAKEIAAQTEIRQLQIQLTEMKENYSRVRRELEERRKAADARMDAVGDEIKDLRRKMSDVHATLKEPRPVQVTVSSHPKSVCDVGTEAVDEVKKSPPPPKIRIRKRQVQMDSDDDVERLQRLRRLRMAAEKRRIELVKRLHYLYVSLGTRRTQARDEWKRRYYSAKKQAPNLESRMNGHRGDLESLIRRIISTLKHCGTESAEIQHLAEQMEKRRVVTREEYKLAEIMLSLTKAIRLRSQAETEGRLLNAELDRRRGELSLVKSTSPSRRAYACSLSPRRRTIRESRDVTSLKSNGRRTVTSHERQRKHVNYKSLSPNRLSNDQTSQESSSQDDMKVPYRTRTQSPKERIQVYRSDVRIKTPDFDISVHSGDEST